MFWYHSAPQPKTTEQHVYKDTPKPEDQELIDAAVAAMREFNQAVALCARRGWAIPLTLEESGTVERTTYVLATNSPIKLMQVRPARISAGKPFKPKGVK